MKITAWVGIDYVHNREVEMEIDDEELKGMDEGEQERYITGVMRDHANTNVVEWGWRSAD